MNPGDCFRQRSLILRFCRRLSDGLYLFSAVDINNGSIFGRNLKEESLPYLHPLNTKVYDRIVRKLQKSQK